MSGDVCLVTGGAGFIGSTLGPLIARRFSKIVALDNFHPQVHPLHPVPLRDVADWDVVTGDIGNPASWSAVLAEYRPDVIVHLAAETGTGQSLERPSLHTGTNVHGTGVMLDALNAAQIRPERIVLASSRAVYGEGAWRRSNGEIWYPPQRGRRALEAREWDYPDSAPEAMSAAIMPRPVSVYGATKLAQEHLLRSWSAANDVEFAALRFQNVYGEGQSLTNSYTGILSLFCRIAREGGVIPLYEDGEMLRDFVHVDDVVKAIDAAIAVERLPDDAVDIGSGRATSMAEAARTVAALFDAPAPEVTAQFRGGDVRHAFADAKPAVDALGFTAGIVVEVGLARLATWIDETLSRDPAERAWSRS